MLRCPSYYESRARDLLPCPQKKTDCEVATAQVIGGAGSDLPRIDTFVREGPSDIRRPEPSVKPLMEVREIRIWKSFNPFLSGVLRALRPVEAPAVVKNQIFEILDVFHGLNTTQPLGPSK